MAIYEVTRESIEPLNGTTFETERIRERGDLQRLLRDHVDVVAPNTLVISEEYGDWEDSRRRIDLLGLDTDANLIVIELKRTEDAGLIELQALRYAAMISTMTFERVVDAHAAYLSKRAIDADARAAILEFLDWTEPDDNVFGKTVRLTLVAADFSKELATTVLWLNDHDLDITCVRVRPYTLDGRLIVDVQQLIPLPEVQEYQVRFREKRREERVAAESDKDYTRFDVTVDGTTLARLSKRRAVFEVVKALYEHEVTPKNILATNPKRARIFHVVSGEVDAAAFAANPADGQTFDPQRWFRHDDELFHVGGKTYALSNQWGKDTVDFLEHLMREFPGRNVTVHPHEAP